VQVGLRRRDDVAVIDRTLDHCRRNVRVIVPILRFAHELSACTIVSTS